MNTTDFLPSEFTTSSEDMERAAEWEEAAKFLDMESSVLAHMRQVEIEVNSQHLARFRDGTIANAPLYCALQHSAPAARLATVSVSEGATLAAARSAANELSLQMAMMGTSGSAAAIHLRTSPPSLDEQELWRLAYDSAALVERVLPPVLLLPDSLPAAAFAHWLSAASARSGRARLRVSGEDARGTCTAVEQVVTAGLKSIVELALLARGRELRGAKIGIQSCGSIGRRCIQALANLDARIVAVADSSGGIISQRGLGASRLLRHLESPGLLMDYAEGDHVTNAEVLGEFADVLILAGGQSDLNGENVGNVNAAVVLELASNSVTIEAAYHLATKGILYVPALLGTCTRALAATLLNPEGGMRPVTSWESWTDAAIRDVWTRVMTLAVQHDVPFHRAPLIAALDTAAKRVRALHHF